MVTRRPPKAHEVRQKNIVSLTQHPYAFSFFAVDQCEVFVDAFFA